MNSANRKNEASKRDGLTLLELLIVLVILAALTGIAVQQLEPLADQSRYEATQQTLENVEEAILSRDIINGQVRYSGFVADIGRLPQVAAVDTDGDGILDTLDLTTVAS